MASESTTFVMGSKTYDRMKKLVQIVLPAISSLYFGLASIWGLPSADKVVGSIAVFTTFLGVLLGISNSQYKASYDGVVNVGQNEGKKTFFLDLNSDPNKITEKKELKFRVETAEAILADPEGPVGPNPA